MCHNVSFQDKVDISRNCSSAITLPIMIPNCANSNGPIVATESYDSDVFTFLEIPLNDDISQRSSRSSTSRSSSFRSRSSGLDSSSGQAPMSILKKAPSYSSLSNLGSQSSPSGGLSLNAGRKIVVEEPELDSFQSPMKRVTSNVSFQSVNVRVYDRTLGDNPSCMSGPPISLDWSYSKATDHCIDEYEGSRTPKRNNSVPMRMNKFKRERLLKSKLGYSDEEIETAKREKKKVQRSRSLTQLISPFWRIEHACQSLKRKFVRRSNKRSVDDDLGRSTRTPHVAGISSSTSQSIDLSTTI